MKYGAVEEAIAVITNRIAGTANSLVISQANGKWEAEIGGWSWGEFEGGWTAEHVMLSEALIALAEKLGKGDA